MTDWYIPEIYSITQTQEAHKASNFFNKKVPLNVLKMQMRMPLS